MRILIANDGFGDAGGVQTYLDAVVPAFVARGHHIALLHVSSDHFAESPDGRSAVAAPMRISVAERGVAGALADVGAWAPDVCFSHNMRDLDVERRLVEVAPVVKFMHGYFGTCVGGQKMRRFPQVAPCDRRLGPACLALYLPCGCGQRDPVAMIRHYRWASDQQLLFPSYAAVLVASAHMKREFVRNGVAEKHVHVTPLFARRGPATDAGDAEPAPPPVTASAVFCGRMTSLKGGDVLIEAAASASRELGQRVSLVMIGDGPRRPAWEQLALRRDVPARFTGWLTGDALWQELRSATVLAMPGTWPEPFGLVGLEAGALGVPAVAFDVGGIREWLRPGENGYLVPADPPRPAAFAAALADALRDPARTAAMRPASRRIACEMSLTHHVDRVERILQAHQAVVAV
jgi:glycosyltransferase involved in cell wall biosynthesis